MKTTLIYLFLVSIVSLHLQSCKTDDSRNISTQKALSNTDGLKDTLDVAAFDLLKPLVEKELTISVALKSTYFKANDTSAFVSATILKKDGSKMDFKGTPFDEQANIGGSFSDNVFGLLKKEGGDWKVKGISVGATDVPFVCWPKAYKVPTAIFPEGVISNQCEDVPPFIFLSDEGRLTLNGGVNITLPELNEQLIESLLSMDKIPDEITPEFGDKVVADSRASLTKVIAEAIARAKTLRGN